VTFNGKLRANPNVISISRVMPLIAGFLADLGAQEITTSPKNIPKERRGMLG